MAVRPTLVGRKRDEKLGTCAGAESGGANCLTLGNRDLGFLGKRGGVRGILKALSLRCL